MDIVYQRGIIPTIEEIVQLYADAGLNRPIADKPRIAEMYAHANLIISAWEGEHLIGVSRSLTDFSFCCYLSDLAVAKKYQAKGIGKKLIELTQEAIGGRCMLLLLSAPAAMEYYPKVGFDKVENGFIINRKA